MNTRKEWVTLCSTGEKILVDVPYVCEPDPMLGGTVIVNPETYFPKLQEIPPIDDCLRLAKWIGGQYDGIEAENARKTAQWRKQNGIQSKLADHATHPPYPFQKFPPDNSTTNPK